MKKIKMASRMSVYLILLTLNMLTAQEVNLPGGEIIFSDHFENNSHHWPVMDDGVQRSELARDVYVMELTRNRAGFKSGQDIVIGPGDDFLIETTARAISGHDYFYGLFWATDWKNTYVFQVSPSGFFTINQEVGWIRNNMRQGDIRTITGRTPSPFIKKGEAFNKLAVKRTGPQLRFYINDSLVSEAPYPGIPIEKIGLQIGGMLKVEYKDILVMVKKAGVILMEPERLIDMGPDLAVSSISIYPSQPNAGNKFTAVVYVTNKGVTDSGDYDLAMYMKDISKGYTYPVGTFRQKALKPGENVPWQKQDLMVNFPGTHQYWVEIIPWQFKDKDEQNNVKGWSFQVK